MNLQELPPANTPPTWHLASSDADARPKRPPKMMPRSTTMPMACRSGLTPFFAGGCATTVDEHGRHWTATATVLSYGGGAVVEGDAYEVAREVARRHLTIATMSL